MKFIDILERSLHLDPISLAFEVYRLMDQLFLLVQLPDKSQDSIRLVIFDMFCLFAPSVFKYNGQGRIQISGLMHPALDLLRPEPGLFKNRIVRQEIYLGTGLSGFPDHRQKSVLQFDHRLASLVSVMINAPVPADLHIHIGGQCIDHRRSHAVETPAGLINRIIKFSPGVQCCIYHPRRRYACRMQIHRHASPVIGNCRGAILLQYHIDLAAEPGQMLVH